MCFHECTGLNCSEVMSNNIDKEMNDLDTLKMRTFKNITPKYPKEAADVCSPLLCDIWTGEIVRKEIFPKDLKNADVTPVFKKDKPLFAKNCRSVSVFKFLKYFKGS